MNHPTNESRVFSDISKAFDKAWNEGMLCKLQTYSIKENH